MVDLYKELNNTQKQAVAVERNTVVAAGAGAGKTKVLARRFVYLITEKNYRVEEILTLTFTEKAAAEMHQRIYAELKSLRKNGSPQQQEHAHTALNEFYTARIMTLDAFCHKIAKTACRNFGISPDFTIDLRESKRLAYNLSLDFFLTHRSNPVLQYFLGNNSIEQFVENLFVKILTQYITVSHPLNFDAMLHRQHAAAETAYEKLYTEITQLLHNFTAYFTIKDNFVAAVKETYDKLPELPLSPDDKAFLPFLHAFEAFTKVNHAKGSKKDKDADVAACKELHTAARDFFPQLLNAYHFHAHKEQVAELYTLCAELQDRFITEKKRKSMLTFADIEQLAVDALTQDPELRQFYKEQTAKIMIDEFQDNNSLQRDLLFLLAEKKDRMDKSVPPAELLEPDVLFFVGDEKQSIYAFRGADVSVFRRLAHDLQTETENSALSLTTNYRTEPELLNLFNRLFEKIFYSDIHTPEAGPVPDYEAEFSSIESRDAIAGLTPQLDVFFIDKKRFAVDADESIAAAFLAAQETEAYTLAQAIRRRYDEKTRVYDDTIKQLRPCRWSDFAVLFRASTHQPVYERFFRQFDIPYASVQQRGLFQDAPLNDLYAWLRLSVYPQDRYAYMQVLRAPLARLSDVSVTKLLLTKEVAPFDTALADHLPEEDQSPFLDACGCFSRLQDAKHHLSNAELITQLWYEEGYRYVLLTEQNYYRYLELYHYLFELAVQSDTAGLTLSNFVDELAAYSTKKEKISDMEIPLDHDTDAVKIMTVHRSKGLEFPIVCIPDCGNTGNQEKKEGSVFFHDEYGVVMHLPQLPDLPAQSNPLFEALRTEENAKHLAETKRLLYVAMTRAKVQLIMSGVQNTQLKAEELPEAARSAEEVALTISMPKQEESNRSFFQLMLGDNNLPESVRFKEVLPIGSSTLQTEKTQKKADITMAAAQYRNAAEKQFSPAPKRLTPVTQIEKDRKWIQLTEQGFHGNIQTDKVTDSDELSSAAFGTLVHKALEARFENQPFLVPDKYKKEVETLCNGFFDSELGKKALNASFRKTEYGFIAVYDRQTLAGQIDLLFEYDGTVFVVDYKTDSRQEPEQHKTQLTVYKQAVENLYKLKNFGRTIADSGAISEENQEKAETMPVKTYLFYLRTQTAVEMVE